MSEVRSSGSEETVFRYPTEINLFAMPPLTNTFVSEDHVDYRPTSLPTSFDSSLEYVIPPTISQFTSLKESSHHIRVRIVNDDGTKVKEAGDLCGPVNWPAVTFFESCMIYLNQQLVSCSGGTDHPYRAIIQCLLDRNSTERERTLQAGLYSKDTAGHMDDLAEEDTGFMKRLQYFVMSESVDLSGPLITDLSEQPKLLPNNVEISVKFWPSKPAFCLLTADDEKKYRIELLDAFLRIKRKTPQPAVLLGITHGLELSDAKYPFLKTEIKKFVIPIGSYTFTKENLFEGQMPTCLVVGFVKAAAAAGSFQLNPFNFVHGNVSSIRAYQDDRPVLPFFTMHYKRSFLQSEFMGAFESLYRGSSDDGGDLASMYCDIERDEYSRGYALYVIRFNSSGREKFLPVQDQANLRISVEFREALTESLVMILYARFPSLMTIDKSRRVTL